MLLMALPFAYLQPRSGALSGRILAGVLIGVVFHLAVTLLGNVALIQQWPVPLITLIPALILVLMTLVSLQWVNRSQAIWPLNLGAGAKS
jgi:lipopolysaccharide export system permease protein